MDILNIAEHIRILEELLLHQDFSKNPDALEAMISADFREINPEGKVVSREAVIGWLQTKDQAARWEFRDFDVRMLAPDLAQATYYARQIAPVARSSSSSKGSIHSSLWQASDKGKTWQLLFHQSTKIK